MSTTHPPATAARRTQPTPRPWARRASTLGMVWALAAVAAALPAGAQQATSGPHNVVQLSASGSVEVEQDWLTLRLATTREDNNAANVQRELQKTVDQALRILRPQSQGEDMQLHTGRFRIQPRHAPKTGKVTHWQGRAEIVLQGRDFVRITQAAARVEDMTVDDVQFNLSRQAAQAVYEQAQAEAVTAFRNRAQQLTTLFGLSRYTVREISVHSGGHTLHMPRAASAMAEFSLAATAKSEPLPVEPGKTRVEVEISGSVQME